MDKLQGGYLVRAVWPMYPSFPYVCVYVWMKLINKKKKKNIIIHLPLPAGWPDMTCDVKGPLNIIHSFIHSQPEIHTA